jgi:CxxC motif-containing protein (DUF1111 family)
MFHKIRAASGGDARATASLIFLASLFVFLLASVSMFGQKDPGVRGGPANAGTAIPGLSAGQTNLFTLGSQLFVQTASVTGSISGTRLGLGPRYNAVICSVCHNQPAVGGTSPSVTPEIAAASDHGAKNTIPSFVVSSGPALIARFINQADGVTPDGSVHSLYTITGRSDASTCSIAQDDFEGNLSKGNISFRIPTPMFGTGLMEEIPDGTIIANMNSNLTLKQGLGISGHPNYTGQGNTITRFGWKAQEPSMLAFSAEAGNTEMGITSPLLPHERDDTSGCVLNGTPEDHPNFAATTVTAAFSLTEDISMFMRCLDQPKPGPMSKSAMNGAVQFANIGCSLCHTPSMQTGKSSVIALSNITANFYTDLLVHHMGPGLADNIVQGYAAGDEFRTAPLWGIGKRIFFMHDGRTTDLYQAIQAHLSLGNGKYADSEANGVVNAYNALSTQNQQDILNFLRSL